MFKSKKIIPFQSLFTTWSSPGQWRPAPRGYVPGRVRGEIDVRLDSLLDGDTTRANGPMDHVCSLMKKHLWDFDGFWWILWVKPPSFEVYPAEPTLMPLGSQSSGPLNLCGSANKWSTISTNMNKPLINDILCAIWRYLPRHFFSTRPIRPIAQANFATNAGAQRHDFDYRRLVAASGSSWEVNCWVHHHHISWGDNMMSRFRYTELYIYVYVVITFPIQIGHFGIYQGIPLPYLFTNPAQEPRPGDSSLHGRFRLT